MKTPVKVRLSERAMENRWVIATMRQYTMTQAIEDALATEASLSGTKQQVLSARAAYRTHRQASEGAA
jgi:hypothetical protein